VFNAPGPKPYETILEDQVNTVRNSLALTTAVKVNQHGKRLPLHTRNHDAYRYLTAVDGHNVILDPVLCV
jgi:hypothetical protein